MKASEKFFGHLSSRAIFLIVFAFLLSQCAHNTHTSQPEEAQVSTGTLGGGAGEVQGSSPQAVYVPPGMSAQKEKEVSEPNSLTQLDEKSRGKVDDAFRAIIMNDDKKAKLAYGRSYKFMPEFIQFAFDLRFRNFEHAMELLPKLPYENEERAFWQKIVAKKPISFSKAICEDFKNAKFKVPALETLPEEMAWSQEYYAVMNELLRKEQSKMKPHGVTPLNAILGKVKFRDGHLKPLALEPEDQKAIYSDEFFDKLRNAQRRDTKYWLDNHKNVLKAWVYQRAYLPLYVYDLYASMTITEHPRKNHFLRRLKGIIKDMRFESLIARSRGNHVIDDKEDAAKLTVVSKFMNRHPFVSVLLYFEPQLSSCGLL